jgi:ParB-like nuclease family protein
MSDMDSNSITKDGGFIPSPAFERERYGDRRGPLESSTTPSREGLPTTYRMRADAHYVDQLAERTSARTIHFMKVEMLGLSGGNPTTAPPVLVASVRRHNVLQPLLVQRRGGRHRVIDGQKRLAAAIVAGIEEVPCLLHDVEDGDVAALAEAANIALVEPPAATSTAPTTDRFSDDLMDSLAAIGAAVGLLSPSSRSLSRSVAVDLINAEIWRAVCLLESTRVQEGQRSIANVLTSPIRVVEAVGQQMAAEARLRRVQVELRTTDVPAGACVRGDEDLIVKALSLLVLSTLIWLEAVPDADVTLRAASLAARSIALEVHQNSVAVPPNWRLGVGDSGEHRANAVPAIAWILGARRIAEALGGQVAISAAGDAGTAMSLTLPLANGRM